MHLGSRRIAGSLVAVAVGITLLAQLYTLPIAVANPLGGLAGALVVASTSLSLSLSLALGYSAVLSCAVGGSLRSILRAAAPGALLLFLAGLVTAALAGYQLGGLGGILLLAGLGLTAWGAARALPVEAPLVWSVAGLALYTIVMGLADRAAQALAGSGVGTYLSLWSLFYGEDLVRHGISGGYSVFHLAGLALLCLAMRKIGGSR